MSISICAFEIAMKKIGVRRVSSALKRYGKFSVNVGNVRFVYSGFREIIFEGYKINTEIRSALVKELKSEYLEAFDFENNRIYTLRGFLTLITMLWGIYSKEFVEQVINETYKELLQNQLILIKPAAVINGMHSEKMLKLYEMINEFDNVVNPFACTTIALKEPSEYLSLFSMNIDSDSEKQFVKITSKSKDGRISMYFEIKNGKYSYNVRSESFDKQTGIGKIMTFTHAYELNSSKEIHNEKVIFYDYVTSMRSSVGTKCIAGLNLWMQTGMAWKNEDSQRAKIVTEKQLEHIIMHLTNCINIARDVFVSKMIS